MTNALFIYLLSSNFLYIFFFSLSLSFFLFLWVAFCSHNTEKVIYFLLLDRKKRRPACEDDAELVVRAQRNEPLDPPKKRIDTLKVNGPGTTQYQLSQGSPIIARRQVYK